MADELLHDVVETEEIPLPVELRAVWPQAHGAVQPCLLVLSGADVGRMVSLDQRDVVVGRAGDADLTLNDDGVSRRHARFSVLADSKVQVTDLGSRNGTWVEGQRVERWILSDGERILLGNGTVLKFGLRDALEASCVNGLYESATRDPLTGLFNKRWLLDHLDREIAWHRRHDRPLSLILIDLDHFKAINDVHGHLAGDEVLRQVGAVCLRQCRSEDVFARFGGDEFACVLRETPLGGGEVVAHRFCAAVAEQRFSLVQALRPVIVPATVSVGLATQHGPELSDPAALFAAADRYLYLSKELGRNRVATPAGGASSAAG